MHACSPAPRRWDGRSIDVDGQQLDLNRFDLLIDWGWFYFITKPLFFAIDYLYRLVGNFGLAILIVTVLIKAAFFPLANKSYASMAKMKAVQPQMTALRERYADDKAKQQQELMELYKREKINPLAGCLPIAIQIPVFFSLYKVLFVTIEMRHAPFFGWIHDLSAQDPTNVFNLFGLIPVDPTMLPVIGHFLHLGAWPLIMGVTMWVQMKLNPAPPDPTQQMIFNWMPLIFTFMLANFPAGLVIYWAWNNSLSVAQQSIIMRKHGAKIELFDNLKALFSEKKTQRRARFFHVMAGHVTQGYTDRGSLITSGQARDCGRSRLSGQCLLIGMPATSSGMTVRLDGNFTRAEIEAGRQPVRRRLAVCRRCRHARVAAADARRGDCVRRPLQCRQIKPGQCADRP